MLDIGLEIKILREQMKVSSKELAAMVGLSQSQMSRLEKGQRRIDTTILHKIAAALGVDPGFFFREESDSPAPGTVVAGDGKQEAARVVAGEAALPPQIRHEHLGKLIRSERRRKHLTVDEFATKVGRTRAYMAALEEGRHSLDAELGDRICRALRLPPSFFVEAQQQTIKVLEKQVRRLDQALAEVHRGELPGDESTSLKRGVPLYGTIGAGLELEFEAGEYPIGEPEEFLFLPGLDESRSFAVAVGDDAMEGPGHPSFREGDIVVLDNGIARSRDFVLVKLADDALLFRQVFFDPGGIVRLQPLNLNHAATTRPRGDLQALWKLAIHIARL